MFMSTEVFSMLGSFNILTCDFNVSETNIEV